MSKGILVKCNKCGADAPKIDGIVSTKNKCKCGGVFTPKFNIKWKN